MINSSAIKNVAYNPETETLKVEFCSGSQYEYSGVTKFAADAVIHGDATCTTTGSSACGFWYEGKNPSAGAAFNDYIKDQYPYQRLT